LSEYAVAGFNSHRSYVAGEIVGEWAGSAHSPHTLSPLPGPSDRLRGQMSCRVHSPPSSVHSGTMGAGESWCI
jgi:hypothetical protein